MISSGRIGTTIAMLALFCGACILALDLPQKAAFMPLLIGIPGALLCAAQLVIDLRRGPEVVEEKDDGGEIGRSEAVIFTWLGGFALAIIGFGFVVGGPLIVFTFVKFASGESWKNALVAGAGTLLVVWGVFIWLLELPLFAGLVLEAIL